MISYKKTTSRGGFSLNNETVYIVKKHLKHLISFLLIFGLTVNEGALYASIHSDKQYQVSFINFRKESSLKHANLYVYGRKTLSKKASIARIAFRKLRDVNSSETSILLKLRIALYQKIDSKIAQSIFLHQRTSSSNTYSCLYIIA
jgi:hypothetical protein